MERKLTHLINKYMFEFKQNIKNKMTELNIEHTEHIKSLFQFIYDYDHLVITKAHLQKRKRTKNIAPLCYRCQARRACGNQCTRRRKDEQQTKTKNNNVAYAVTTRSRSYARARSVCLYII